MLKIFRITLFIFSMKTSWQLIWMESMDLTAVENESVLLLGITILKDSALHVDIQTL